MMSNLCPLPADGRSMADINVSCDICSQGMIDTWRRRQSHFAKLLATHDKDPKYIAMSDRYSEAVTKDDFVCQEWLKCGLEEMGRKLAPTHN
jgi:predicted lipoprotein